MATYFHKLSSGEWHFLDTNIANQYSQYFYKQIRIYGYSYIFNIHDTVINEHNFELNIRIRIPKTNITNIYCYKRIRIIFTRAYHKCFQIKLLILQTPWSADEQKLLEQALKTYPATLGPERWEKIADCLPNRSKKDCMKRYKELAGELSLLIPIYGNKAIYYLK